MRCRFIVVGDFVDDQPDVGLARHADRIGRQPLVRGGAGRNRHVLIEQADGSLMIPGVLQRQDAETGFR